MPTTFQFMASLARRHAGKGAGDLSAAEVSAVVEAMNAGLVKMFEALPPHWRSREVVFSGSPRLDIACVLTHGSATLGAAVFQPEEVGRSVLFAQGGDAAWHRVAAPDRLVMPWLGASGTWQGSVYPDALAPTGLLARVQRLADHPVVILEDGHRRTLRLLPTGEGARAVADRPSLGTPQYYEVESSGFVLAEGSGQGSLRVWPLPLTAVRVVASAELWPLPVSVALAGAGEGGPQLPIPEAAMEEALDLCGPALALLPGWQVRSYNLCVVKAAGAEQRLSNFPTVLHRPHHTVGTPAGY